MSEVSTGPWRVLRRGGQGPVILDADQKAVAYVDTRDLQTDEANAHLIVAAPTLLAALEAARPLLAQAVDAVQGTDYALQRLLDNSVQAADAAIMKATGGE